MFYQGGPIDNLTHVPGTVAEYSSESEYTAAFTAEMYLAHFMMLHNDFLSKDTDMLPEQSPIIIFDGKPAVFMAKSGKNTKHQTHFQKNAFFDKW